MQKVVSILAALMIVSIGSIANAAGLSVVSAYGVDTIAGYSSIVSTSKTYPNVNVVFKIEKPDNTSFSISDKTDSAGVAVADVDEYHTKTAGRYYVSARYESQATYGQKSYFDVYADEVSLSSSTVSVDKSVVKADGNDMGNVNVKITDQYGNPVEGHSVFLISSRNGDSVVLRDKQFTDESGNIGFSVSSTSEGLSVYSAYDVTEGKVIDKRVQVAFMMNYGATGGTLDTLFDKAYAQSSGPVASFEISDLPANIAPNQNISFKTTARDSSNLKVENYTGTVHFSAEGANSINAILPEDYVFKPDDLGEHDFGLGLKFIQPGTYTIVVTDISNQLIKGEKIVTVGSETNTTTTTSTGSSISIATPTAGTYGQDQFTISGTATAGSNLKVFDGTTQLAAIQAGNDGKFSYQTEVLSTGEHSFVVKAVDASEVVLAESAAVVVIVDKSAPQVEDIILTPSGQAEPGSVVNLQVYSEEGLLTVAVIFNSDITELNPSLENPSIYVGQLPMPAEEGTYSISVVLVDQLNNEQTYDDAASIEVKVGAVSTLPDDDVTSTDAVDETLSGDGLPPSQVIGAVAYGSDKRVTLVWDAATDDGQIVNYRIYYGTNPTNLIGVVDTFDNKTTWYVPELDNGKEYYFSIFAIDEMGNESVSGSQIVSAIPFTLEVQNALPDRPASELGMGAEDALLKGSAIEGRVPDELVQNGPELIWLLLGTGLMSGVSRKFSKKKRK